ncbi:MAG: hypothetical protein M0R77_02385 [Gammaproteobacteria bacterium]|nr:hypothetical protein [Gammaproteobacteria bacterium]
MREYIDAVTKLYQDEMSTLTESLGNASEYELDLILESMDKEDLFALNRKLMEFNHPSDQDVSLMTKIGAKIFGQQWAAERQGAMQAMDDQAKFMADWGKYSKRFNQELTVDNLKQFLKTQYKMGDATFNDAVKQVKPETDRATGKIVNIEDFIPALSFAYFYGVGDAIETRAEEKHIDIDDLGYENLPQNQTKFKAEPETNANKSGEEAADGEEDKSQATGSEPADAGSLSASQISTKMGKTLNSLHISAADRQQAINDAKRGFTQSFSKNSRTLAALGYSYLKAINAV